MPFQLIRDHLKRLNIGIYRPSPVLKLSLHNVAASRRFTMSGSTDADLISISENQTSERRGGDRGGGRGRGRGGRGGGGGGGLSREVQISKGLSKLLRHAAGDAGLKLDAEGFARVDRVVSITLFYVLNLQR